MRWIIDAMLWLLCIALAALSLRTMWLLLQALEKYINS